ncbi:hypothetical protein AAGS61_03185 [Lysinibacillus sp. KU-BSD001]
MLIKNCNTIPSAPKVKRQEQGDVVRHPLVAKVIQAYADQEL